MNSDWLGCCDSDTPYLNTLKQNTVKQLTSLYSHYDGVIVVEVVIEQMFLRLTERTALFTFNAAEEKT